MVILAGILGGAVIGAAVGGVIGAVTYHHCTECWLDLGRDFQVYAGMFWGGFVGAIGGPIVSALWRSGRRLLVGALLAALGAGLAAAFAWNDGSQDVAEKKPPTVSRFWPTWSPDGRRIAFMGGGDEPPWHLYVMNADGSNVRKLPHVSDVLTFQWSPDGRTIAFDTGVPDRPRIYVVNADGTGLRRLTPRSIPAEEPAWSPDGREISFTRHLRGDRTDIFVISLDGRTQRRLTHARGLFDDASASVWSPDGRQIAFLKSETDIYVMNADGSNQRNLFDTLGSKRPTWGELPAWSPHGDMIAFVAHRPLNILGETAELFVIDAAGGGVRNLTRSYPPAKPTFDTGVGEFTWSPNGRQIAFSRHGAIELVSVDGTGRHRLTHDAADPAWSPNGRRIAFAGCVKDCTDIGVMNADASERRLLTK